MSNEAGRRAKLRPAVERALDIAQRFDTHFHLPDAASTSNVNLTALAIGALSRAMQLEPVSGRYEPADQARLLDEAAALCLVLAQRAEDEAQHALATTMPGRLIQAAGQRRRVAGID